ncbi:MAG: hypothetical protein K6T81_18345 [Alicyclobacillus macrosporangiidus]|uniref:hypothetical protein n=1 Tax=Alicyclobacillus macrosporangiidus TaxID=392015 RepID=UPI0026EF5342|nr:hypothetical protein [Alicyclobacillus macrosporangiidus]MCL6600669.1 hypothetical protein [Alicyclobacillus macrosporangiidus]
MSITTVAVRPRIKTYTNDWPVIPTANGDQPVYIGRLEVYRNVNSSVAVIPDEVISDDSLVAMFEHEMDIPSYVRMRAETVATVEVPTVRGVRTMSAKKLSSFVMFCLGVFGVGCVLTKQIMSTFGGILLAAFCFFVSYQMWKDSEEGGYRH